MYLYAVLSDPLREESCYHRRRTIPERIRAPPPATTFIIQQVVITHSALNLAFCTKQYNLEINLLQSMQICPLLFNGYTVFPSVKVPQAESQIDIYVYLPKSAFYFMF